MSRSGAGRSGGSGQEASAASSSPGPDEVAAMRTRLRELRQARADLPPHSAQGWHEDLDDQIATLRRRLARATHDT